MNTKNTKVSKHNQNRRGIDNQNINTIKKSSGLSSKARDRKIEADYKKNFRFFPA
jgi:hypothetical protein